MVGDDRQFHQIVAVCGCRLRASKPEAWDDLESVLSVVGAMAAEAPNYSSLAWRAHVCEQPKVGAHRDNSARWDLRGGDSKKPSLPQLLGGTDSGSAGTTISHAHSETV